MTGGRWEGLEDVGRDCRALGGTGGRWEGLEDVGRDWRTWGGTGGRGDVGRVHKYEFNQKHYEQLVQSILNQIIEGCVNVKMC